MSNIVIEPVYVKSSASLEQKFICIHNAVYMLERVGFKCRQQAVEAIKNADSHEAKLDELFAHCAKLLEITSRETKTYNDVTSRSSDWIDAKNSILEMLRRPNA